MSEHTPGITRPDATGGSTDHYGTVIIGGGQAGLATGYYLDRAGEDFVILDAGSRIGEAWRSRWDSLRLFTPARYSALPGMDFPTSPHYCPTKDEMADYLEAYAERFELPVELETHVERLDRDGDGFRVATGDRTIRADNVVVAMATHQVPTVPAFADDLDPGIRQLHSSAYQSPADLPDGDVLVVGAGNSGAEIALDLADTHDVTLSGRDVGHVPFHIDSWFGRHLGVPFVLRVLFHRILTVDTPMGRRMRERMHNRGMMLVRTKPRDLREAGIERVGRTAGVDGGRPVLEDDRMLDVSSVVWATGYRPNFSWIDLPIFESEDAIEPDHYRGVVEEVPGLYFVGLLFLYAASSEILCGLGRDAKHVADHLVARNGGRSKLSLETPLTTNPAP